VTIDAYLAPGHGRHPETGRIDPGATAGDANEQRDGDLICRAAERHLIDVYGLTVYRQPRGGPDFRGTIPDIERRKPRVAVEVHHDWNRAPRGGFGFWRTDDQLRLCRSIQQHYLTAGLPVRRHMQHLPGTDQFPAIVRRTHAVLWEADRIGAVTDHGLYGRVLADGIAAYLNAEPITEDVMTPEQEAKLDALARDVAQIKAALGNRAVGVDLERLRLTARAHAAHDGLETEHDVPEGPVPA